MNRILLIGLINDERKVTLMKIKKIACLLMALAMIWMTASCRVNDGSVTELTDPPGIQQTTPADPGSDGPSKPVEPVDPVDPSAPSEPDVTEPGLSDPDPSEPVVDPSTPSEPVSPVEPSEPEHEHAYSEAVTAATCTEDGFTTYSCECGDTYVGDRVEATGHSWGEWVTVTEPTEAATGTAERKCSACDAAESKVLDKIIPNHTHSYTSKVTKQATCSAEGVMTYTCSCGGSYTEKIDKISHSYGKTVTAPTCTEKGYTTYKCSSCGNSYKDDYVNAKGHSYSNYKSNGDATCTADGTKTGSCSTCGAKNTLTDTGSAKGHSYSKSVTAPTCTEKGYTTNKCGVCGDSYKDSYVNATGHKFGSYTSNGDATCTKDGTKTAICSNGCGTKDTKTDTGSALGHSYSKDSVVEPTLWSTGYTVYACSRCSDSYKADHRELTAEEKSDFLRAVEDAVFKYINQFREEEGETPATNLPGMRQVAQYRAVQLARNFAHDEDDIREAHNVYKYGTYVDLTPYGYSDQYYTSNGTEAIAYTGAGHDYDADIIGYKIARQFYNSEGHWRYLKMSWYAYMSVGVWVDEHDGVSFGGFYTCIMVSSENHG